MIEYRLYGEQCFDPSFGVPSAQEIFHPPPLGLSSLTSFGVLPSPVYPHLRGDTQSLRLLNKNCIESSLAQPVDVFGSSSTSPVYSGALSIPGRASTNVTNLSDAFSGTDPFSANFSLAPQEQPHVPSSDSLLIPSHLVDDPTLLDDLHDLLSSHSGLQVSMSAPSSPSHLLTTALSPRASGSGPGSPCRSQETITHTLHPPLSLEVSQAGPTELLGDPGGAGPGRGHSAVSRQASVLRRAVSVNLPLQDMRSALAPYESGCDGDGVRGARGTRRRRVVSEWVERVAAAIDADEKENLFFQSGS